MRGISEIPISQVFTHPPFSQAERRHLSSSAHDPAIANTPPEPAHRGHVGCVGSAGCGGACKNEGAMTGEAQECACGPRHNGKRRAKVAPAKGLRGKEKWLGGRIGKNGCHK